MVKPMFNLVIFVLIPSIAILLLSRLATGLYAAPRTYTETDVPVRRVALVLGAGLLRDGSPTSILRDRVQRAANLYFARKIEKLLMSGDNRFENYNEPEAMRQYALQLGVPDGAIVLDYAGRRTYDSCYRAKAIFGLHEAVLITQQFHLPRAIFLCNMLGVDGVGVDSDLRTYRNSAMFFWNLRELPATLNAFLDVVMRPLPVLGDPEPIFPENAQ